MPSEPGWDPPVLPDNTGIESVQAVAPSIRQMLLSISTLILDRMERTTTPWIDTKFDIITGRDFASDDPLRGPDTVYGWIQGRGLESLVAHARLFADEPGFTARAEPVIRELMGSIQRARELNDGHLHFFMNPDGKALHLQKDGVFLPHTLDSKSLYSFSDLFAAKGMRAAAAYLNDDNISAEAGTYGRQVAESILDRSFRSDQQPLDPKESVEPPLGCSTHASYMLAIGHMALAVESGNIDALPWGLVMVDHILNRHVNDGRWPDLEMNDYVEFIDDRDEPWITEGCVIGDPGHALEFVGLTLKLTHAARQYPSIEGCPTERITAIEGRMPALLRHIFGYGFHDPPGGIRKRVDLRTKLPVNTDMPWWSLPETMRAALYTWRIATEEDDRAEALRIFAKCWNAFTRNYVRPDRNLMAIQTLGGDGQPAQAIPATPDLDPGYHTGLSLIDCLKVMEEME